MERKLLWRQEKAHLEDMSPILPLVVEPLIQHLHDFDKVISAWILAW
jgi:hypothetical protein